jgi:hypothetical protein
MITQEQLNEADAELDNMNDASEEDFATILVRNADLRMAFLIQESQNNKE